MHERLAPLPARDREIILRAAAIGRRFDVALLAELTQSSTRRVTAALRAASRLQVIAPLHRSGGWFEFRHALTREAVYEELVALELRSLHGAIGAALERLQPQRRADLEDLAYHWWAAADPIRGAHYNEAAGDRATAVHAIEQALDYYQRALDVLSPGAPARRPIETKMARLRSLCGPMG
ncbi:MAG: hypothetical protein JOZ24_11750 [Candidatus Eremiobacteraeota bacterium]|nr:hypothetical protein [Candidatus Eremiobacteraeota bacterium]